MKVKRLLQSVTFPYELEISYLDLPKKYIHQSKKNETLQVSITATNFSSSMTSVT